MCERKSAGGKGPEYGNTCPNQIKKDPIMEGLHATILAPGTLLGGLRIAKLKRSKRPGPFLFEGRGDWKAYDSSRLVLLLWEFRFRV